MGGQPRRARMRIPIGLGLAALAMVVILITSGAIIIVELLGGTTARREGYATPQPGVAAGPEAWQLPQRSWPSLPAPDPASLLHTIQTNELNALAPVALVGCAAPATVTTEAEWQEAVRGQWACLHNSWLPTLQRLGWSTADVSIHFFAGPGSDSSCGYLEAPAFYCSVGKGSVHFGTRHFDMARTWELSVNEMVNHEYGHHLQSLSGITAAKNALPRETELERRAELQATCWSAAMTYRNDAVSFSDIDYGSWQERLETMEADSFHGSRESLMWWGTRGLYAEVLGDCNTWLVPGADVT